MSRERAVLTANRCFYQALIITVDSEWRMVPHQTSELPLDLPPQPPAVVH